MNKNRLFNVSMALALLLPVLVHGQEADLKAGDTDSDVVEEAQDTTEDEGADSAREAQQPNVNPEDAEKVVNKETEPEPAQPEINPDATFTPTEEISEDKPVAFPVDI